MPLNLLQPALEGASLQEDPYLQNTWANLLANAADPRRITSVEPAFVGILKELSSREVKFLDALFEYYHSHQPSSQLFAQIQLLQIYTAAGLAEYPTLYAITAAAMVENREIIDRDATAWELTLGLLTKHALLQLTMQAQPVLFDPARFLGGQANRGMKFDVKMREAFAFTQLGRSFVAACRPPVRVKAADTPAPTMGS